MWGRSHAAAWREFEWLTGKNLTDWLPKGWTLKSQIERWLIATWTKSDQAATYDGWVHLRKELTDWGKSELFVWRELASFDRDWWVKEQSSRTQQWSCWMLNRDWSSADLD